MASKALFAVCNPIQLLAAVCIRLTDVQCRDIDRCDLVVAPKFPGAEEVVSDGSLAARFDNVALYDPFDGNYYPQFKSCLDYHLKSEGKRTQFFDSWPLGNIRYDVFYCGDPHMIVDVHAYLPADPYQVIFFDEGLGSYMGRVSSFFCVRGKTPLRECARSGRRALIKELLKRCFQIVDKGDSYFLRPSVLKLFNPDALEATATSEAIAVEKIRVPLVAELEAGCSLFRGKGEGYSDVRQIYLGAWRELVDDPSQVSLVNEIAGVSGNGVIVRPHPRSPFKTTACVQGVRVDGTDDLWELLCLTGKVSERHVLVGFASTAQATPLFLAGSEPIVVIINDARFGSALSDNARRLSEMLKRLYSNPGRVIDVEKQEDVAAVIAEINDMGERFE